MFKSLAVENFKGIGSKQNVPLAPLTVFAGANNSGKSSILHALLIIAQSVRSLYEDTPLVLDDVLFQRGEAEDLVHAGRDEMSLAFEIGLDRRIFGHDDSSLRVEADFRLRRGPRKGEKRLQLTSELLTVFYPFGGIESFRIQRRAAGWTGKLGSAPPQWMRGSGPEYRLIDESGGGSDAIGVLLRGLLPQTAIDRRDARNDRFQQLLHHLLLFRPQEAHSLNDDATSLARVLLDDDDIHNPQDISARQRTRLRTFRYAERPPESARDFLAHLKGDYRWSRRRMPSPMDDAIASLRSLAAGVRHVGPLRLPPQFVHSTGHYSPDRGVGSAGEFTVAEFSRARQIETVAVDPVTGIERMMPLGEAVIKWLAHMGIIEDIRIEHKAKVGHYLWVQPSGTERLFDLTNIGVGASQILPVLVQALISPPGSVLIFEQPELHLHPRLQSILADFFIGLARSGRQCLVETHSEHLVDRIRLRIAEADDDAVSDLTKIYFVQRRNGESRFDQVDVNKYGNIEEWPEGFFDESQIEAERILRSSLRKRMAVDDD